MNPRLNKDGKSEPRFDIDVKRGRQGELQWGELLDWIAKGDGAVEVKTKSYFDFNVYVEVSCDKGRKGIYEPSGIQVTAAHVWAFCIEGTGISVMVPTDLLRGMLNDPTTRDVEELDGSCPTRGKLVKLGVLLFRLKQQREKPTPPRPANTFGHDLAQDKITIEPSAAVEAKPKDPLVAKIAERITRELRADEIKW